MKKNVILVVIGFVVCGGIFSVIYTQFLRNNLYDVVYKGRIKILEDILPPDKLKKLTPIEWIIIQRHSALFKA